MRIERRDSAHVALDVFSKSVSLSLYRHSRILDRNCKPADHGVGRSPFWPSASKTSAVGPRFDPRRGGNSRRRPGLSIGKDTFLTTTLCRAPDHLGADFAPPPSPQTTPHLVSAEATTAAEAGTSRVDSGRDMVL